MNTHAIDMKRFLPLILMVLFLGGTARGAVTAVPTEESLLQQVRTARSSLARGKAYVDLARWYERNNAPEKATDTYRKSLGEKLWRKDMYAVHVALGDLYLKALQYAPAIESYQEAVLLIPRTEAAHLGLAAAYEQSELFELARQEYLGILKRDSGSFEANFGLASLYLRQGLNTPAMECYRQALLLRPGADVYRKMASCAENAGDIALSAAMLRQIISAERTYEDNLQLGRSYEELKKFKESEEAYSLAIQLDPGRMEGYIALSLLYMRSGNVTPAEKLLQIAQVKAPDQGLPHFFAGIIYCNRQDYVAARREMGKALELAKSDVLRRYSRKFLMFLENAAKTRQ